MKKTTILMAIVMTSLFSSSASAGLFGGTLEMTCGRVLKVRAGKLLNRLEPSMFGINSKYVLFTRLDNPIGYIEKHSKDTFSSNSFTTNDMERTYTRFSWKDKYRKIKKAFKAALKKANRNNRDLYACVGRVDVLLKYSGAEVFFSEESVEVAMKRMRKQVRRHL